MKSKLTLIILLLLSFNFYGQTNQKTTKINGKILNGNYSNISLLDIISGNTVAKSNIKNKNFSLKFDLNKENIMILFLDRRHYIVMDIKPGDNIEISYDPFTGTKTVKGSENTKYIINTFSQIKNTPNQKQEYILDSILDANPNKLASVFFAMNLNYDKYPKTHDKIIKSLKNFKGNKLYDEYLKNYTAAKSVRIGNIAPEIALPDTNGKIIKLSSLRGKYVLVDFWASWCSPCRHENPNVLAAYNKYHKKGFTIYSVSLDKYKNSWLQAIHQDHLNQWTHVSDLKGWQSAAAATYGIRGIPSNLLLDKKGKIIAKNLRGKDLEDKLAKIFNK
jgi:peroxiredoxin